MFLHTQGLRLDYYFLVLTLENNWKIFKGRLHSFANRSHFHIHRIGWQKKAVQDGDFLLLLSARSSCVSIMYIICLSDYCFFLAFFLWARSPSRLKGVRYVRCCLSSTFLLVIQWRWQFGLYVCYTNITESSA